MSQEIYEFKIGHFDCMVIQDGSLSGEAQQFFGDVPAAELDQVVSAYGLSAGALEGSYNCLFANTGQQRLLVDAGQGIAMSPHGRLLQNLRAAGIQPQTIDLIIITHGHLDHYGGLVDEDGNLIFANARYAMWQSEWEWATTERLAEVEETNPEYAAAMRQHLLPIQEKLTLIDESTAQIAAGIRAIPAPGHTPAHTALSLQSDNEELLCVADAFIHPIHVEKPAWAFPNDASPAQATNTRQTLNKVAARSSARLLAYHFPFPGLGQVLNTGNGHKWQPVI